MMRILSQFLFKEQWPRWTEEEKKFIKDYYIQQREKNVAHSEIYQYLANKFNRTFASVKQLVQRMYKTDKDLQKYKYENWNREKVLAILKDLYVSGKSMNRSSLPAKLRFQIANHSLPRAIIYNFDVWFNSFDDAIAEAILSVGFRRDQHGNLTDEVITSLDEARQYYRRFLRKVIFGQKKKY